MKLNGNYVAVKPVEVKSEVTSAGGVILTSTYSDENPLIGEVVALGARANCQFNGADNNDEFRADARMVELKVGDKVLYPKGVSTAYYSDVTKKNSEICVLEARFIYAILD